MSNATTITGPGVLGYVLSTVGTVTSYIRADAISQPAELTFLDTQAGYATAQSIPLGIWLASQSYNPSSIGLSPVAALNVNALTHYQPYALSYDSASPQAQLFSQGVAAINLTAAGTGYAAGTPPTVVITPANGAGATAVVNLAAGVVSSIYVTNGGSGYLVAPTVVFSSGAATATAVITGGVVTAVNVTGGGSGYTSAPTLTFVPASGTGSGATATAAIDAGTLVAVNVTAGGTGYSQSAPPSVTITGGTFSVQATAKAVVSTAGVVTAVYITNPGTYTVTTGVTVTFGSGTAAATAVFGAGAVTAITVTAAGSAYVYPPLITFTGGAGSGVKAVSVLSPATVHASADNLAAVVNALSTEVVRLTHQRRYRD